MKATIGKKQKVITVTPAPDKDYPQALKVFLGKGYDVPDGCKPIAYADLVKGKRKYYPSDEMVGNIDRIEIIVWYTILMSENESIEVENGRPSEFKEEYIAMAEDYLEERKDTFEDGKKKVNLPTIEGFATYIGASVKTLYNWSKDSQEFLQALEMIKREQHDRLVNNGLAKNYDATITKLILSSNHGYKEKSDLTSGDVPLEAGVVVLPAKEE